MEQLIEICCFPSMDHTLPPQHKPPDVLAVHCPGHQGMEQHERHGTRVHCRVDLQKPLSSVKPCFGTTSDWCFGLGPNTDTIRASLYCWRASDRSGSVRSGRVGLSDSTRSKGSCRLLRSSPHLRLSILLKSNVHHRPQASVSSCLNCLGFL